MDPPPPAASAAPRARRLRWHDPPGRQSRALSNTTARGRPTPAPPRASACASHTSRCASFGAEIEGALAPTTVASTRALLFAARYSIAQLPLASVVPFVLVGGGLLGTRGNTLGQDLDLVGHFGGGLKIDVHRNAALRLDLRGTIGSGDGTETRRVVYPRSCSASASR